MKVVSRILSIVLLAGAAMLYMNCGGSDPKPNSKQKEQHDKLKGSWTVSTVTLDGDSRTDFAGVVMTLGSTLSSSNTFSYSFTGTFPNPSPWPKTGGNFSFGSDPVTMLVRTPDDVNITYNLSNSDQTLSMSFNYAGAGFAGGRVNEVEGDWSFSFTKN